MNLPVGSLGVTPKRLIDLSKADGWQVSGRFLAAENNHSSIFTGSYAILADSGSETFLLTPVIMPLLFSPCIYFCFFQIFFIFQICQK
jgi:hypothetical protein